MRKRIETHTVPPRLAVAAPHRPLTIALTVVPLGTVLVAVTFWALAWVIIDTSNRLFGN